MSFIFIIYNFQVPFADNYIYINLNLNIRLSLENNVSKMIAYTTIMTNLHSLIPHNFYTPPSYVDFHYVCLKSRLIQYKFTQMLNQNTKSE